MAEAKRTKIDEIGESRILSNRQRRWLDGENDVLKNDNRKVWYKIRKRLESAFTELKFIHERMPPEQLEKIGKGGWKNERLPPSVRELDDEKGPMIRGAGMALASTTGLEKTLNEIEPDVSGVRSEEDLAKVIAAYVEGVFDDADYEREEYGSKWSDLSYKVRMQLER